MWKRWSAGNIFQMHCNRSPGCALHTTIWLERVNVCRILVIVFLETSIPKSFTSVSEVVLGSLDTLHTSFHYNLSESLTSYLPGSLLWLNNIEFLIILVTPAPSPVLWASTILPPQSFSEVVLLFLMLFQVTAQTLADVLYCVKLEDNPQFLVDFTSFKHFKVKV